MNNSGAAVFNMSATSNSYEKIYIFDQHYQAGKTTSQVSVLMVEYIVALSFKLYMM